MTVDSAIEVEGLSKQYRLGSRSTRHDTLRDLIASRVRSLFHKNGRSAERDHTFWALQDVSFVLQPGKVMGIIGRNGAGKSTLLRILSRITEPTTGCAAIYGRVGSLLEVGTGFHPELTGRENIYLNGAVLGMKKAEIDRKFDEMVAFAEVDQFIDTPVKRYSSGMYVRLAFAVAAHLEPEILIVDEVLAVGDASFQKKCMGKMGDVAREGRTVLLVSHNMSAIINLCNEALVLEKGKVAFIGDPEQGVRRYLDSTATHEYGFVDISNHVDREAGMQTIARAVGLRTAGSQNGYCTTVTTGDDLIFEIHYDSNEYVIDEFKLAVSTLTGQRVFTVGTHLCPGFEQAVRGPGIIECRLPHVALAAGEYTVTVMMGKQMPPHLLDYVENALRFRVELGDYFGTGRTILPGQGPHAQKSDWTSRA